MIKANSIGHEIAEVLEKNGEMKENELIFDTISLPPGPIGFAIQEMAKKGLLSRVDGRVKLSDLGKRELAQIKRSV
jgi:predicted transcriptional regulator